MNHKFDQCVSQKDVMSWRRDIVMSDTSGLYDYPFNILIWLESSVLIKTKYLFMLI